MNNQTTNAPPVLSMLWGVALIAVLFYFGASMHEFTIFSTSQMLGGGDVFPKYFWGVIFACLALPAAVLFWAIIAMLAPTKPVSLLQKPVTVLVGVVMLLRWFFYARGFGNSIIPVYGLGPGVGDPEGPTWFGITVLALISCAIVLAAVYISAVWSRIVARALVTLFAPDGIREHFAPLYAPDHAPEAPGNPSETPEGEG